MNYLKYFSRKYPTHIIEITHVFNEKILIEAKSRKWKLAKLKAHCYYDSGKPKYSAGTIVFVYSNGHEYFALAKAQVETGSGYHSFFISQCDFFVIPHFTRKDWESFSVGGDA